MKTYLWRLNEKNLDKTNLSLYSDFIKQKYNINSDGDYNTLWKWSVDHPRFFWKSIWNFTKVLGKLGNIDLEE